MAANYWFFSAIIASLMWGLGYVLSEILLKQEGITPVFIAAMTSMVTLPIFIGLAFYYNDFKSGFSTLWQNQQLIPILLLEAFTIVGGTFLIYTSIAEKNASLVAVIESTYPIFSVFFAFVILKQLQINIWAGAGMILIMAGITLIYFKSS